MLFRVQNFLSVTLIFLSTHFCYAKEISVGQNGRFRTIHQALTVADSGDAINVMAGVYAEGEIVIQKPVKIHGIKDAVIDGQSKTQIFLVKANHVTIEGFTIQNSGYSDIHEPAGVRLEDASDCIVKNNRFINTFFAIYLSNAFHCEITNNKIEGTARTEASSGNGIHLWKSSSIIIDGNVISGHRDGIYFEFVKNSTIVHNVSEKNLRYGLHFMFSDNDSYEENVFRNNGSGVAVMYSKKVTMKHNRFENNWGGAAYGLLLKEISHSEICYNGFLRNSTGIYMEGTGTSVFHHNEFKSNGWALKIWGDCTDDTVRMNNFYENTFDVSTNASTNNNWFENNYWDHYTGYDLNHDNIGDVPFHPVSLYSKLTEESPYMLMLLHSFLVDILDRTEKMLPSVTPEQFSDNKPQMRPIFQLPILN